MRFCHVTFLRERSSTLLNGRDRALDMAGRKRMRLRPLNAGKASRWPGQSEHEPVHVKHIWLGPDTSFGGSVRPPETGSCPKLDKGGISVKNPLLGSA